MKIAIVINTGEYKRHSKMGEVFFNALREKGYEIKIIDLGKDIPAHEKSGMIKQVQPQLIITFDMAGFELRTTLDSASYNVMPYRMAHILPGEYPLYSKWLQESMNFSMFFYALSETAEEIKKNHPETENVYSVDTFSSPRWWDDNNIVCDLINKIVNDTEIELDF